MKLEGSEIKSIREKKVNITESYCIINNNEIWVKNMDVPKYSFFTNQHYEPKKERKLLLKKTEIKKIKKSLETKGMSLIPTKLLINEKGFAKLEVAIGKGKKTYDKRESLKERDVKLEIHRKKREK